MTERTTAGSRNTRGPARFHLTVAAAAVALALPAPAHAAPGPLTAMCKADRRGSPQAMTIVAYATVSPGDVASRLTVHCMVTGVQYGYANGVSSTAVGVAVVATGVEPLVAADNFEVCYEASAAFVGGGAATFTRRCDPL